MSLNYLVSPLSTYPPAPRWQRPWGFALKSASGKRKVIISCMRAKNPSDQSSSSLVTRRSANYQPTIWAHDFVQSLTNDHMGESCIHQAIKLKDNVRMILEREASDILHKLELVDTLQRLGVSYHFETEIKIILERVYNHYYKNNIKWCIEDLYATALKFRLLRQHNHNVPQEVFNEFMDESGNFKACLSEDIKGMLYLYEASYLARSSESKLDEARDFATKHLEEKLLKDDLKKMTDHNYIGLADLVSHALELPLHWRVARLEARWFIDVYEKQTCMDPMLLEFAKLDFNMVQATHQKDLKHLSRWWKGIGWGENLQFARNRLMENYMWTVGLNFTPQFENGRRVLTKVNACITTIDDVYDVYGTLDELNLFTNAIERWSVSAIDLLPDYMKICFLGFYNSINEIAYGTLKEQNFCIIPYLKKAWTDLCQSYLVEAKWYKQGYTPTLEEYMNNAWISISAPLILVHAYFLTTNHLTEEALEYCLRKYPTIVRQSATILRLADDLGTSSEEIKRGDVPKSIQCYIHETGASEEEAREHIKMLISETWKKMNEEKVAASSVCSQGFIEIALNLARMSQCMYQYGDGHGSQDSVTRDRVFSLFVDHVPIG